MDRNGLSRLPFLTAFFIAVAAMPLDIYSFNQRNVGTAVLSPWQRGVSAAVDGLRSFGAAIRAFLRSPGLRFGLAAAMLILAMSGHLPHGGDGALFAVGLTDPKELREQINKLATDMQAITTKAKEEKRENLTPEEEQAFDKMDAEREKLIADERRALRIQELENPEGRRAAPRQPGERPTKEETRGGVQISSAERVEALRSWLQAGTENVLSAEQRSLCDRIKLNPYAKVFNLRLAPTTPKGHSTGTLDSIREASFKAWEERALSTLTSTSPEDGSYLIANEAMGPLERALLAFGGMRQASTVRRTTTGANYPIPTNDDTSNKGALLAENTIAVAKDPAFGQLVLNAFKFTSKKVLVSLELMQDSNENLAEVIGSILGERIGRITNDYFTTGSGSSEPKGIVTASTASGTQLAAKTPTYVELVATEGAVDPAYRDGAAWMFHDTMLSEIKKIVDSQNRPIWLPSMSGGAPDRILGYPYFVNQSMAVAAASGAGKAMLFGKLSKYIIRDVRDVTLFRLDELYAEYFQVAFVAFSRHDGDLLDAGTHPVVHTLNKA